MNSLKDYYKILDITISATQDEIKKAYRKKAHELHPDKQHDNSATSDFQEINTAYQTLSDKLLRKEYDNNTLTNKFSFTYTYTPDEPKQDVDILKYNTNINTLTCSCKDFLLDRAQYSINDPRRLCKHLIASFEDDNKYKNFSNPTEVIVPKNFIPFGKTISDCKLKKKGFYKFKKFYIHQNFIIAQGNNPTYVDVWVEEGKNDYWYKATFKDERIVNFDEEYEVISAGWYGGNGGWTISSIPSVLSCYIISNKLNISLDKLGVLDFKNDFENYECEMSLKQVDEHFDKFLFFKNLLNELGIIKGTKININYEGFFYLKDNARATLLCNMCKFQDLAKKIQEEINKVIKINLTFDDRIINTYNIKNETYEKFHQYEYQPEKLKNEEISLKNKYDTLTNLIDKHLIDISTIQFNKILKRIGLITKQSSLNQNNWIIKGDGLNYGINLTKESKNTNKCIPGWYKVQKYDAIQMKFINLEYTTDVKMTSALFEKTKFNELYQLVKLEVENKPSAKKVRNLTINDKKIEREKWLRHVNCPRCGEKTNIHKKDKRKLIAGQVQRFYCNECNHMFQMNLDELEKLIKEYEENEIKKEKFTILKETVKGQSVVKKEIKPVKTPKSQEDESNVFKKFFSFFK